jgi:colanic acid/amylovoran biosynthesis glycosyltransferase
MRLLYFHGSTLQAFFATGKVHFLSALNPGGLFESVHMVNIDTRADRDVEDVVGAFRFTALGLGRRGPGLRAKLAALRESVGRLEEQAPALVLADDANLLGLAARRIARRRGVPYAVCIYYDNDLHYRLTGKPAMAVLGSRHLERLWERYVLRGAAGVYAQTRGYRDYGLRRGAAPSRTYLANWCVDDVFYGEPPVPHPDGREMLFIGRLHHLKFVEDLLRAVARLPADVRLDVAGEGPHRPRLEALIQAEGLSGRVRLLGMRPREELRERMAAARVLLATQGVSAVVECLLSGRPVVAYDHECNAEFVRDGQTGVLVPFRDVAALAAAVGKVLAEPAWADGLGRAGRRAMREECRIEESIEHRRRFFERCLQT